MAAIAQQASNTQIQTQRRLQSIDILRGAVMIIMALDHTRDFFHNAAGAFSPTDLARTTAVLFFTRWVTHFCAPVFMFTAGLGAFLWAYRRRQTKSQLSRYLWTRGLWLLLLEVTVVRFSLGFHFFKDPVLLLVFWSLGASMIFLSALVYLPVRILAPLSIAVIALHNLLDPVQSAQFGAAGWLWKILHERGVIITVFNIPFVVAYPIIPWPAIMAAGYCCGYLFLLEPRRRQALLRQLGLGLTLAFTLIRAANIYGDPSRWVHQNSTLFTFLSFLNTTKYPPSLDYILMTLGPALVVLGLLEKYRIQLSDANPLLVFGRVPLFYFVLHLFVLHVSAVLLAALFRHNPTALFDQPPYPPEYGYSLGITYVVWLAAVAILYPLCRWFMQIKQRQRHWILSYL